MTLRYHGRTVGRVMGRSTHVAVDPVAGTMGVWRAPEESPEGHGRKHRYLMLAARRALACDAAYMWLLDKGGVHLNLAGPEGPSQSLAARMCRPHLEVPRALPLYPYQRDGVARLLRNRAFLLADDMGLGKTLQVIAALRALLVSGRIQNALICAPATLVANWLDEIQKWTPSLVAVRARDRKQHGRIQWDQVQAQTHIIVTNYEHIRSPAVREGLGKVDLLVLDEAQRLKNAQSLSNRSIRRLQADRTWALTGTPVERGTEDFATLLSLLDNRAFTPSDASLSPMAFRARAKRFVLRREKWDVIGELPPVVRRHEHLEMTSNQAKQYKQPCRTKGSRHLFAEFNRLLTACDYAETGDSTKLDRIVTILGKIKAAGEKAIVFSFRLEPLRLLAQRLRSEGIAYEVLEGKMDADERQEAVGRFKHGTPVALLASMRVASEGLTLVEANHVLFVNRWWNPSQNQQATDRAVRIGQQRTVFVYTFTMKDTVEETLDAILHGKEQLFDELVRQLKQEATKGDPRRALMAALKRQGESPGG